MTYKGIFFVVLLVPATFTYSQSVEEQIQELKNNRFKKELELSDLGRMIAEKEELFHKIWSRSNDAVLDLAEKKKEASSLSEQEVQEFIKEINNALQSFEESFDRALALKKNIRQFLSKELIRERNRNFEDFETLKFCVVRNALEHNLLKTLVERYEECLQELLNFDHKLGELQK